MQVHASAREVREQGWKPIECSGQKGINKMCLSLMKASIKKKILQYNLKVTKTMRQIWIKPTLRGQRNSLM